MTATKHLAKATLGRDELNYGVQLKTTWHDSRGGEDKCAMGRGLPIRWDRDLAGMGEFPWERKNHFDAKLAKKLPFRHVPSLLFATCRHVVDLPYVDKDRLGSKLQNLTIRWVAGELCADCDLGRDGFRVFVPRNSKLDLALVVLPSEKKGDFPLPPPHLLTVPLTQISDHAGLCSDLDWGARVGFVSQQPWTGDLPILRTGVVASDPQATFNAGPDVDMDEILLLEAQSFSGSSGSPVWAYPIGSPIHSDISHSMYELERHKPAHLVGIMSGHLKNNKSNAGMLYQQHVGLSYCHKLEALWKLLTGQEGLIEL